MSHFSSIKTRLNDADALVAALRELGLQLVVHAEAQPLQGYYGGSEGQSAEIIIPAAGLGTQADIGFARQGDGTFQLIWDLYEAERRYLPNSSLSFTQLPERLPALYARHLAIAVAHRKGHTVTAVEARADGGYTLRIQPRTVQSTTDKRRR
ncbi:DUF1257 domain-containing protein [Gloeobacter kilaueensis]|uniref:Ycf35 n=1 Tax=Gloeobacter kilaueensis (strain ATCC BAA-2537 / CCAP 1431/1 / ULC 316 / JS1) TaxID=1183438 RepID=U5QGD4_GLOK1|nr:DUF1257 domain-containing protein [Gloeobacter kilaueensis]AGY57981.1 Ycf35 [Gloeobacter kilaueensis JS1]